MMIVLGKIHASESKKGRRSGNDKLSYSTSKNRWKGLEKRDYDFFENLYLWIKDITEKLGNLPPSIKQPAWYLGQHFTDLRRGLYLGGALYFCGDHVFFNKKIKLSNEIGFIFEDLYFFHKVKRIHRISTQFFLVGIVSLFSVAMLEEGFISTWNFNDSRGAFYFLGKFRLRALYLGGYQESARSTLLGVNMGPKPPGKKLGKHKNIK